MIKKLHEALTYFLTELQKRKEKAEEIVKELKGLLDKFIETEEKESLITREEII